MRMKLKQINLKKYRITTKIIIWSIRTITILLLTYGIIGIFLRRSDDSQSSDYVFIAINAIALLIATFVPRFIRKKWKIIIPEMSLRIYLLFVTAALLLGEIGGFFVYVSWWDSALHLISGSLIGIVGFSLIDILNKSNSDKFKLSPIFVALFVFCFSLAVGVIWEIIEFTVDALTESNMQRFKDSVTGELWLGRKALTDTMKDFILNTIGATIISILGYIDLRRKTGMISKMSLKKDIKEEII